MGRGILLTSNLPHLQNLIKRDPVAYREEFLQQWNHFNSIRQLFHINPDEQADHFRELVTFITQVAVCYPKDTARFPATISTLLLDNYGALSPDTRKTLVQNLVMLRHKEVISSIELLKTLFPLLPRTTSPSLRASIQKIILSDIYLANSRTKNHKLNRVVQAMLFGMVEKGMEGDIIGDKGKFRASHTFEDIGDTGKIEEPLLAIVTTKELWKRGIWTDAKTVSIIAQGCFHPVAKVQLASLHFFIGSEETAETNDDDLNEVDVRALHHQREINKKTKSRDNKLRKKLRSAKKRSAKESSLSNLPAIQLLHDPQTFGEKLYDILNRYDKRFSLDHKILVMQLLSRIMGLHKLCILGFYTYIVKYIVHRQLRVPAILVAIAQSVHDLTPPDAVTPVVRKLAQEFVHPGVGGEVIAAGLNSIREICRRQPWSMEADLLEDLVEYRKSRDKAVVSAARGLLTLYREVNPDLLKKSERGKEATMGISNGVHPLPYGHIAKAAEDIEGLSLLEEHMKTLHSAIPDDVDVEAAWQGWDTDSNSSMDSDSEGWMDVEDNDVDLVIHDSEDEAGHDSEDEAGHDNKDTAISIPSVFSVSTLATTKILTPADFSLLNDLRARVAIKKGSGHGGKRKLSGLEGKRGMSGHAQFEDVFVTENDILGPRKKAKADYAERMASIQKGREGREKFGSLKGKRSKAVPSSSTNREKARNKPIMMMMSSGAIKGKKKASLREKQQKLRAHIDKSKKARR